MLRFAVIMAGGSGERFWPASRRARPKQLLRLTDPVLSMIEEAIERIAPLIPHERILIVTSEILARPIADALPSLPRANILAEPEKRNTAACLALAAAHLEQRHGEQEMTMAVLTADHQIGAPDRFRATVARALDFAAEEDALVTIGVTPTRAETGYGYIEVEPAKPGTTHAGVAQPLRVLRFREKPSEAIAREYAKSGHHFWNSGMFFWRVSTLLRGLAKHMGDLELAERGMVTALRERGAGASLRKIFLPLADVSIDIGLMERASNVYVMPADFPWDDVGAWDALERTRTADEHRNVVVGDAVLVDVHDAIVFNEPGAEEMAVAVVGLDNVVVATTRDGILVCAKDRAQDVKLAVAELRRRGRERFT